MNSSNFDFIQGEWPDLYTNARRAEQHIYTAPRTAAFYSRLSLEMAVRWMYENDLDLDYPYNNTLSGLLHEYSFKSILRRSLFQDIDYIRKIGNDAAHKQRANSSTEALESVKNLLRFFNWMARSYLENASIQRFDESLVPQTGQTEKSLAELQGLEQRYQVQVKQNQQQLERLQNIEAENKKLQAALKALAQIKQQNVAKHSAVEDSVIEVPAMRSEAETRRLYIDRYLAEAGWHLSNGKDVQIEYPVTGMPNKKSKGYVDYVLFGDNGLPLAVVEAKRSSKGADLGQEQARLYADCLEAATGQRPIIFYSNGVEHYLWDDLHYGPRAVSGFYTKAELQRLIQKRKQAKALNWVAPNPNIAGRYYQIEAIQRMMERLTKNNRAGLLVMATGSGKTRVAISMVDILVKANWVNRVLFLADRLVLVRQAKKNFGYHLTDLSSINLSEEKNNDLSRLVFSTYPTMMNAIDSKRADDTNLFSPGHFDLIVVDEAHRSVYKKYQAIFDYFDAIHIGLTATPKSEVDKNTYELFGCADEDPTYEYTLEQAVADRYLNPYKVVSIPTKFMQEGIKYKDLSEREKQEYEEKCFGEEEMDFQDEIAASALNEWLFNANTVDKVLKHLMDWGQKVEEGDKLGKTIIFAKTKKHASFILERFEKNYPEYKGDFAKVVVNDINYVRNIIDEFELRDKMPQIAISVDMLDTGVDVPDVLNLVFFKRVRSFSKFWQMIGRGTRLCPDIFGPGRDKNYFSIFDVCGNFDYFGENPEGITGKQSKSLTQRSFEMQLDIAQALQNLHYQDAKHQEIRQDLLNKSYAYLKRLDRESFVVRPHLELLSRFEQRAALDTLTKTDVLHIKEKLSLLIHPEETDQAARQFDAQMYRFMLTLLEGKRVRALVEKVVANAKALAAMGHLSLVKEKKVPILEAADPAYWASPTLLKVEYIRQELRTLMRLLEPVVRAQIYTDFEDELTVSEEESVSYGTSAKPHYKIRVERFFEEHKHHVTIQKLRSNQPITKAELGELERILFEQTEGSKKELEAVYGVLPLGKFIRQIVGLDIRAAKDAFAKFLQAPDTNLEANQIHFINQIIDYLNEKGTIAAKMLYQPPFNDNGDVDVIFGDSANRIFSIIQAIDENALGA